VREGVRGRESKQERNREIARAQECEAREGKKRGSEQECLSEAERARAGAKASTGRASE